MTSRRERAAARWALALLALAGATALVRAGAAAPVRSGAAAPARVAPRDEIGRALRTGRYEDARRLARARLGRAPDDLAATLQAARAETALGLAAEARRRLEAAAAAHPDDLALRDALMRLYEASGDRAALAPLVDASYADWNGGQVDRSRPGELIAVATAVRLDGNWKDANDTLREAVRADRGATAANLDWGTLLLDKHNAADAEACFQDVLKLDPESPEAHFGLAEVAIVGQYDAARARDEIARTLAVNPAHAGALALRASLALDAEDWEGARADAALARRTNPRDTGAARIEAALALLLDDREGYARARDRDLAVNAHDGAFFAFVAEALTRHRRYDDARAVGEAGVAAAPDDAACLQALATTLLRLGEEGAGLDALRRAWKRDPYDVRTFNLLNLFEKTIPSETVMVASAHLKFRVPPAARAAIQAVVAPFLEERYGAYVRRYGFEPKGPVTFELYGDPHAFAVRTVGLPTIGVAGVCFGRVITSQSPTNHAFNWGLVLAHELAHVFAIELSRSRVPRWFTEGLSEVETMHARPEWVRHDDAALYGAWRRGELPPLTALSNAFLGARSAEEATRAYAHAALAVEFLERRFGFPALRAALSAWGRGERGDAVLERLAGMPAAALEKVFRDDLRTRFARYESQYLPTQTLTGPGRAALGALATGDTTGARRALDKARAAPRSGANADDDNQATVAFLTGEMALGRRDADAAVAAFEGLLALDPPRHDGYDVRVRLALAEIHRHRPAAAEDHLRRAIAFDPARVEPHALLAELYGHAQRQPDRLAELEAALRLDPQTDAVAKEAVLAAAKAKQSGRVLELAPIAIFIDPGDPDLHAALGRALAATGKPAAAADAFERALALEAPDAASLHRALATLYDTLGNRNRADAHRAAAAK
jgi:tetratricopeptide (TPR) repeat protein